MEPLKHVATYEIKEAFICPDVKLMLKLQDLIDLHYKIRRDAHFYCEALNASPKYLNKTTMFYFNGTVHDMVQQRLLAESKCLLITTKMSVKLITYELGFSDASYFCRWFKASTGCRPSTFRKLIRAT